MATGKKAKKAAIPAEEAKADEALKAFNKANEGKTLTDDQKAKKAGLVVALGKMKFLRIANKRIPRTLASIKGIANLGGKQYVKSEAQVKAICESLEAAVKDVRNALEGTKATVGGFTLPGFDDAAPDKK